MHCLRIRGWVFPESSKFSAAKIALVATFLLFYSFLSNNAAFAINSPTITKVQNVAVAPATTMYAPSTSVQLSGNAEASTEIKVYRDTTLVGTCNTAATGVWDITLTSQPQGSFGFSATAFDGLFLSQNSVVVPVMVDTAAPSISIFYGNAGCRSGAKFQCQVGLFYSTVSDSLSGVDFNTSSYVLEYADMPTTGNPDDYVVPSWNLIPGVVANNGSNQITFSPTDWNLIRQPFRKLRITSSISDKAGNAVSQIKTFYMAYGLRPPPPTVSHIWDPGHNVFTGTGEPATNLPDAGGWVVYYPYMTLLNNPTKVRGAVAQWNNENEGWYASRMGEENNIRRSLNIIDQATGKWEMDFAGYPHPFGDYTLNIRAKDSGDCLGRNPVYVYIKTLAGTPYPASSWTPSGEPAIIGDRLIPTITGNATKVPFKQTIQVGWGDYSYTTWAPFYSQVVLPETQVTAGTAGVYDDGDVWYDANNNGLWDAGEEYLDMPSITSNGQTYTLLNFRSIEYNHNTLSYLGILSRNNIGKSSANRVVRAHNNDTYPPLLNEVVLSPLQSSPYRKSVARPNLMTVKARTWGGNYSGAWSWSGHYYLNGALSPITLTNGQGVDIPLPAPTWPHLGSLVFQADLDISGVALPEGTYQIGVGLEDNLTNRTVDNSNWFMIDDTAPNAADMVPADGVLSNTFTSFNAKIVDPNLADGSAGSGANINVSVPQIWPSRILTNPATVTMNGRNRWTFTLSDGELFPTDHKSSSLSTGDSVEIWETSGGIYDPVTVTGTIDSIVGDGTVKIQHPGTFSKNKTYVVMYTIPFFTSNNGTDRVGAVPVSAVTADGTYVTKVVTRDKADNTGTFFTTSSPLEVPVGLITYTFDQPFLFAGLEPPDVGTYTTSSVRTRKLNPVQDGQPLSLVQIPNTLSEIFPPDANGIPGDGHQVLFGQNGATPGSGQAAFGVKALTSTAGSLTVYGVIGLATGTSDPLSIFQIDNFTLAPALATLDITPGNPNPSTLVSTSLLGRAPRNVPDGSMATCTTNFGSITPDESALPGIQVLASNGSASVNISSNTKGTANVGIEIGGKIANTTVTFFDKYPPPAPTGILVAPQASNTGASTISWLASIDIGGAGTLDYTIEQSANGGAFVGIATTTSLSYSVSGLADGSYVYRILARDADGNVGAVSAVSLPLIIDTVAPPAAACSDIGAGNTDPDEHFSVDPNIYFYYTPTDDRSGVGDVQVQVSVTPDISGLVYEPWVGPSTPYIFPDGSGGFTYYARVRVKDKAGNIGPWGSWSNGIFCNITGAVTPPNSPTITKVAGKNAVPGIPVPVNVTTNILINGLSEASNLIEVHVDNVYQNSVISNGSGNFSALINLPAGLHTVKVKAHNGFAGSGFSNTISIVVDLTLPTMSKTVYDVHGYVRGTRYLSTDRSAHPIKTIDFYLADAGGSGFDITTAQASLTDIDDSGTPIPAVGTYTNPISGSMEIIAADRVRFTPTLSWKESLQNGHRYRINYQISDFAGNIRTYNFDFVTDENYPSDAAGVPAAVDTENPNVKTLYMYNLEAFPWSTWPTAGDLVPFTWDTTENAYMIDPTFVNPALVDWGTTPHSLLFNTVAIYGSLYAADQPEPPTKKGGDSESSGFHLAWGYGSGISMAANPLGTTQSFRFPFRTMVNGLSTFTLVDQDHAICRTNRNVKFWINSANPAPSPPSSIQFSNANNPAIIYPIWYPYTLLFGTAGSLIGNREILITDNSSPLLLTVKVPVELFNQTVELYQDGVGVVTSAVVSPGNDTAILTVDQAAASGYIRFQVRSYANGYYSTNLPRYVAYYWYHWIKGDTTPPETFETYPTETNYNGLAGADARPFPSRFSVKAKDTADGSTISYLEIAATSITMENAGGTTLAGTLSRDYITSNSSYGFRYQISAAPTTEGTYYYKLTLPDGSRPSANSTTAQFPFRLDKTAPIPLQVNPSDGEVTNSLPSFNAQIGDPLLADGSPGSGPNMDPSRIQIFPFKNLGQAPAGSTTSLTATVYGLDAIATDHVDKKFPINTAIWFSKILAGGVLEFPSTTGKITVNAGDVITATVVSGPALIPGTSYAIVYEIPNFPSNDGIDRIAAVPIQPAIKGGSYVVFLKLIDNSLNQGSYAACSSIYEAAYGPFDLFPSRTSLYVGLYPPHTSNYVSSPILTTEGNPIKVNTEVTVLPDKGSYSPADSNGIPGDGHQVKADAAGKLNFGLQATGLATGLVKVRAVLGLASGTDQSVSFIQIPAYSMAWSADSLDITPFTPNPVFTGTSSALGNAGDLVPNGTCLNVYHDLGTVGPADLYPLEAGHQATTFGGVGNFTISSTDAGVASVSVEVGGRWINKTLTFVDKYPPNAPGTPSLDNTLNNNGVFNIIWAASTDPANSGIAEYGIEYSLNGGAYNFLASSTSSGYLTSGLLQGVYKFKVRAVDGAGNVGAFSAESVSAEVDSTPPLGTIVVNGGAARTAITSVSLVLSATDAKGVADMSFSNDSITWGGWAPLAITSAWTLSTGDGPKLVYVRFRDTVGNIGIFSDGITLDTTGPLGGVALSPKPYSATSTLSVECSASDGSGVTTMNISYDGGVTNSVPFSSLLYWNAGAGFATHTVLISYVDGLGNVSASYTAQTCVDTILPTTPVVTDDGVYSPWLDKLHATWTTSDAQTGVAYSLVRVGTAAGLADVVAETNVGNVNEITFSSLALDITGATQYFFTVKAIDFAGNISIEASSDGIKGGDPTPPLPVTITDDGVYSGDNTILHATWSASSDPDSGINRYEFSAGTTAGGLNVVPWTDLSLALNHTATGLTLTNGQIYYINVKIWNNGGTSTVSISDGITIDIVAPTVPTLNTEPAYSSGTVNIVSCAAVTDALSGGVEYYFARATDAAFTAGLANSGWIATPTYTFAGLTHGVNYFFKVKARDAVANESAFSPTLSSIQDSNPPTSVSYSDNVAGNADPNEQWTQDVNVAFAAVTLTDDLSGVKNVYVQVATESTFLNPLSAGVWLNNTTGAYSYSVPAVDGSTIFAQARYEDQAGNLSPYYKTNGITLDLSNPAAGATTDLVAGNNDIDHTVSADPNLYFSFIHSDAISGVANVRIQIASDSAFTLIATDVWTGGAALSYWYKEGADFSTYWARIMVKDNAERVSTWGAPSDGIRVDMSAPADPSLNMFYINKPPTEYVDESSTATATVYLTLTISDPSGVASASVSNDGVIWTVWLNPALDPASISWALPPVIGDNKIWMVFEDGVGNVSAIASKTIEAYNHFKIIEGDRSTNTYPVDTYDEYRGQNKYGTDRSDLNNPNAGKSLILKTP